MPDPEQYTAVALQPAYRFARERAEIMDNIRHIGELMRTAIWLSSNSLPVRLVALPEGVLQGFPDELHDMRHGDYLERLAVDVPGPETDALGELAARHDTYIVFQIRARDAQLPGYYFNNALIVSPAGEIVHRYTKLQVAAIEPSATPLDVHDRWAEVHGWTLDSLFPVADTPIGRIGTMVCYDGNYPEIARGLVMNGAEILYRCSSATTTISQGWWSVVNRARAIDNSCYFIAPNMGPATIPLEDGELESDIGGGHSMVIDAAGQVLGEAGGGADTWAAATIDVAGLRENRIRSRRVPLKALGSEYYGLIYEQPVRPRNSYGDGPDLRLAERAEIMQRTSDGLLARGVFAPSERCAESKRDEEVVG